MIVQALRHQLQRQRVFVSRRLLDFGALILEPNFYLRLIETQLAAELLASTFSQVAVLGKLVLEPSQLWAAKGGARSLVVAGGGRTLLRRGLFWLASAGTCKESEKNNGLKIDRAKSCPRHVD